MLHDRLPARYDFATNGRRGKLIFCLGIFTLVVIRAEAAEVTPVSPLPASLPIIHLTDEQNRLMPGTLDPSAEKQGAANALYAEAVLHLDDRAADPQRALAQLRRVVALDPHFPEAQIRIANLLVQSGQIPQALDQLKIAAAANPDSIPIEATLGYVQKLLDNDDEALRLCADALAHDSSQTTAMRVLLAIAGDRDNLAAGVANIESILKAGGPSVPASAWLALARLYLEVGRNQIHPPTGDITLRTLLPIYQQAAAIPPPDVESLTLLADTYRDLGQKTEALKTLRQAVALEPSTVDLLLRCADLESDLGRRAEALKDYEDAYSLNPNLLGLREMLGRIYLQDKRFDQAIRLLQEALADAPDDPGLAINLAIAYEQTKQPEKAQSCFQRVFASPVCPPEAYLKLAAFQFTGGRIKDAGKTLDAAAARFPKSARVRFFQAIEFRYAKKYPAALAALKETRLLSVGSESDVIDVSYYLELATTLNLAGKKDSVASTLHDGLSHFPEDTDLMNELAYFWADQGEHLPEALALSRRAVELDPHNGPIQDTCGWVYYRLGQIKEALPYLQRAALLTNNDPVVLQHLGDAYLEMGLEHEAIVTWRRALKNDPGNRDLAGRIDAALAQANDAHLRRAPNK